MWEDSGGVFIGAGLTVELLPFSFFGVVELEASSGLGLTVFNGLATEEEEEEEVESFFLVTTASPVFFFTLSLFTLFTLSVFTLAFTFGPFSFFVLSDRVFDVDLVEGLTGAAVLLEAGALEVVVPTGGLEEMGGVLVWEGISSIGSSLTGVASPLSTDCCDGSGSSPVFFFLTFFVFKTLALDLVPDEEDDGGW